MSESEVKRLINDLRIFLEDCLQQSHVCDQDASYVLTAFYCEMIHIQYSLVNHASYKVLLDSSLGRIHEAASHVGDFSCLQGYGADLLEQRGYASDNIKAA